MHGVYVGAAGLAHARLASAGKADRGAWLAARGCCTSGTACARIPAASAARARDRTPATRAHTSFVLMRPHRRARHIRMPSAAPAAYSPQASLDEW